MLSQQRDQRRRAYSRKSKPREAQWLIIKIAPVAMEALCEVPIERCPTGVASHSSAGLGEQLVRNLKWCATQCPLATNEVCQMRSTLTSSCSFSEPIKCRPVRMSLNPIQRL